jgi:hypothetical protein
LKQPDQHQHAEDNILIDKCGIHDGKRVYVCVFGGEMTKGVS